MFSSRDIGLKITVTLMDTLEILSKLSIDDDFFPTASIIRDSRETFWFHFGLNIFAVNPHSISTQLRLSVYPNRCLFGESLFRFEAWTYLASCRRTNNLAKPPTPKLGMPDATPRKHKNTK
jgi:hypothetical protein